MCQMATAVEQTNEEEMLRRFRYYGAPRIELEFPNYATDAGDYSEIAKCDFNETRFRERNSIYTKTIHLVSLTSGTNKNDTLLSTFAESLPPEMG